MNLFKKSLCLLVLSLVWFGDTYSQEKHYYQTDFSVAEFKERRTKLFETIGNKAIAIIQGARGVGGFNVFRQTNTFYYLSGLETPHAYLLLDGRNKRTTLYLPHRDSARERNEGKILSAEDADLIKKLTGVDHVRAVEFLSLDVVGGQMRPPAPILFTPLVRQKREPIAVMSVFAVRRGSIRTLGMVSRPARLGFESF